MLISQAARSAGLIGWPKLGACGFVAWANTTCTLRVSTTANPAALRIHMLHLAATLDRPAHDGIVVMARIGGYRRYLRGLAASRHQLGTHGLLIARLIPSPALQNRGTAIPTPRRAEPGKRLAMDWFLELRLRPALATIGGDHHF